MAPRRESGTAEVEDLFRKKDGSPSALFNRIEAEGRDPKRVKRWRVRWVDYDGKQKTKSFDRKSQAVDHKKQVSSQLTKGEYIDAKLGKVTVGAMYERWEPSTVYLAEKTRDNRKNIWKNHVHQRWDDIEISAIRKTEIQQWVADLHAEGKGESLISQTVGVLRLVLEYAVDDGRLSANPAMDIKIPRAEKVERHYLTVRQVETLQEAIGGTYSTLIRVLAYTGLRWGEATALRVMDVDLDRRRLHVVKTFSNTRGRIIEKDPKSYERRSVVYPNIRHEELTELVESRPLTTGYSELPMGRSFPPVIFATGNSSPAGGTRGKLLVLPFRR